MAIEAEARIVAIAMTYGMLDLVSDRQAGGCGDDAESGGRDGGDGGGGDDVRHVWLLWAWAPAVAALDLCLLDHEGLNKRLTRRRGRGIIASPSGHFSCCGVASRLWYDAKSVFCVGVVGAIRDTGNATTAAGSDPLPFFCSKWSAGLNSGSSPARAEDRHDSVGIDLGLKPESHINRIDGGWLPALACMAMHHNRDFAAVRRAADAYA